MHQHFGEGQSPLNAFFAAADANKDGKLTKEEVGDFFWKRLSKASPEGSNAVTKDELIAYHKKRFEEWRAAAHKENRGHKQQDKPAAAKPNEKPAANDKSKPEAAPAKSDSKPVQKSEMEKPTDVKAGTSAT